MNFQDIQKDCPFKINERCGAKTGTIRATGFHISWSPDNRCCEEDSCGLFYLAKLLEKEKQNET